jgi:hypothetical protein
MENVVFPISREIRIIEPVEDTRRIGENFTRLYPPRVSSTSVPEFDTRERVTPVEVQPEKGVASSFHW